MPESFDQSMPECQPDTDIEMSTEDLARLFSIVFQPSAEFPCVDPLNPQGVVGR